MDARHARLGSALLAMALASCFMSGASAYKITAVTKPLIMSESPYWCDDTNTVTFVDVIGQLVLRYDPATQDLKNISFAGQQGRVTPAVPVVASQGTRILVGVGRRLHFVEVDWGAPGQPTTVTKDEQLCEVESSMPNNRFNDGKADSEGRLWIGTMDDSQTSRRRRRRGLRGLAQQPNKGELFRFDLGHNAERKVHAEPTLADPIGLSIPNGMAWTPDASTYYLADSATKEIYRFDFAASTGTVGNRTTVFRFADYNLPGAPDGMTLDVDGNLWIACVHGGQVIQVDPRTGELLQKIPMGVTNVSAAEWGGPYRDVLYVTSSRYKMDEAQLKEEPEAGCMFAITGLGTRGHAAVPHAVQLKSASWRPNVSWIFTSLAVLLSLHSIACRDSSLAL